MSQKLFNFEQTPVLQCCNCGKPGKHYRQNTCYVEEELNWIIICERCQVEVDEYWEDMWQEYRQSRI